jgi:hypothetical protein
MGRLWAMDQAISKCKEVGGVKCVAVGKKHIMFWPSVITLVMIFSS